MGATVAIILPTWNRADLVRCAISSVLGQSWTDWELVVVDDGSTDATADSVAPFLRECRIKYLSRPHQGQAAARNAGVRATSAPLVCFLDSDDYWSPTKLEEQVTEAQRNPSAAVIFGEEDEVDVDGRVLTKRRMKRSSGDVLIPLLWDNFVPMSASMVRRSALESVGGLDESLRRADDYDLWLRLSLSHRFLYVPRTWSFCRVMPNQISSDKEGRFAANELIVERILARADDRLSPRVAREARCRLQVRRSRYYSSAMLRSKAIRSAVRAIVLLPWREAPWRALGRALLLSSGRIAPWRRGTAETRQHEEPGPVP